METVQERVQCLVWLAESKSPVIVQIMFRAKYGKEPPNLKLIESWMEELLENGLIEQTKIREKLPKFKNSGYEETIEQRQNFIVQSTDIWSRLRGDDDFKNLDYQKLWGLLSLATSEVLATSILVGVGCSGLVTGIAGTEGTVTHLNVMLTFSMALTIVLTVFSHISGCHVNPIVSLSAVISGHLSLPRFLLFTISQCIGSILGICAVKVIAPTECTANDFCMTVPNPYVGVGRALLAEAVMTGILIMVVNAAWDRRCQDTRDSLPIKLGFTVGALGLAGTKYSGCSMNPARSFGPAFMAGNFSNHWVYWVGPVAGSAIASFIYKIFFAEMDPPRQVPNRNNTDHGNPL